MIKENFDYSTLLDRYPDVISFFIFFLSIIFSIFVSKKYKNHFKREGGYPRLAPLPDPQKMNDAVKEAAKEGKKILGILGKVILFFLIMFIMTYLYKLISN